MVTVSYVAYSSIFLMVSQLIMVTYPLRPHDGRHVQLEISVSLKISILLQVDKVPYGTYRLIRYRIVPTG